MIFIELFLLRKIRIPKRDSCASKNSSKNIVITTKATSVGFQCMVHAWCTHGARMVDGCKLKKRIGLSLFVEYLFSLINHQSNFIDDDGKSILYRACGSRAGDAHWGIRSCTICPILCIIFLVTTINHCFGYISIKNVILSNIYHAYECFELLRINR